MSCETDLASIKTNGDDLKTKMDTLILLMQDIKEALTGSK